MGKKLLMLHLFHNEWDEEKIVCDVCLNHNGKKEIERLLNEGVIDDRDIFWYSRVGFLRFGQSCAICDSVFKANTLKEATK